MTENDELLESIRLQEHQQLSFFERHLSTSSITNTSAIEKVISIDRKLAFKILKTDKFTALLPGILLAVLWSVLITGSITNKTSTSDGLIFAFFGIGVITAAYIYSSFIKITLNFTISLSAKGIAFNDALFEWSQIKETAILHLPIGKHGTKYLVLLFTNDQFEKWELSNFASFPHAFPTKLANYIEYFKSKAIENQPG